MATFRDHCGHGGTKMTVPHHLQPSWKEVVKPPPPFEDHCKCQRLRLQHVIAEVRERPLMAHGCLSVLHIRLFSCVCSGEENSRRNGWKILSIPVPEQASSGLGVIFVPHISPSYPHDICMPWLICCFRIEKLSIPKNGTRVDRQSWANNEMHS